METDPYRARPFITFMYGTASRVGELIPYTHIYRKVLGDISFLESPGITKGGVLLGPDGVTITLKNFKNKSRPQKDVFISNKREGWICSIIEDYVVNRPEGTLFNFKRHTALNMIKKELGIRSHDLRHSRLTHLFRHFDYGNYEIKETAGHSSLETSGIYVHLRKKDLKRKLENPVLEEGLE